MNIMGFDRRDMLMLSNLFRMALTDRYLGSALGTVWAFLSPLMLLGIFCFVFTFVFPNRMAGATSTLTFVIWLFSGYGPWLSISEGLSNGTASVVGSAGIVKNIAFKSELLPVVGALLGLVPLAVSFVLIALLQLVNGTLPQPAMLILPLVVLLQLVFVAGLGMFLGALNVFVRDTALILPNLLTILLFASPIFYALTAYPAFAQSVLVFNPFYVIAECYRDPILNGRLPPLWMLAYLTICASLSLTGGLLWFRRLKNFFDTRL
ncbi:ABC transporter permease [Bradyrhizobium sp. JYMT SZCCT0428]|uniref:ABC transporter permease n=1 Tax=Bradyrhizobium sp. JYMT SZCCT0428 TaxID=2807673 RepID=UPI001BA76F1B|nr:ABC transporter permease [Bradyrhizobium sp. JYMT SZCCT0428]MBR1156122.1 ABC transporter permease [Bradyrhizobium sp. JYMT SZCCT0428]